MHGFAMVTAIFILVVLAMLGAFIATISSQNQVGAALDVQGARAYQAARAGIEWGLYQVLKAGTNNCNSSGTGANVALPGITGFTVTVRCAQVVPTTDEAGIGALYNLTAWACNTTAATCPGTVSSLGYVERKIVVLAEKCASGASPPC
jgi:MSHA biogenesis protein MshP